jgi:hypothetical protein
MTSETVAIAGPTIGVVVGGGITAFAQWRQRKSDRADRLLDGAVASVAEVQARGSDWLLYADRFVSVLADSADMEAVVEHPLWLEFRTAGHALMSALTVGRVWATDEQLRRLDPLRQLFYESEGAAMEAAQGDRSLTHSDRIGPYALAVADFQTMFNDYLYPATEDLRHRKNSVTRGDRLAWVRRLAPPYRRA